ncbi:hypothetical protein MMC12_006292 [Toensbergia leucococca]|nr:hypothetical protein [Toensbergia leucococca]
MVPLEIHVQGTSVLQRPAERGALSVAVSSDGLSQEMVSKQITSTSNQLQNMFKELAPKTEAGLPTETAPVTVFSMTSVRTRSWIPEDKDGNPLFRKYEASTQFEVIFRDFDRLGQVATTLLTMPHAEIKSTSWRLTDETMESMGSESRQMAMRNAVQKATDYADVVGRKVVAVEITDQYSSTRGRATQSLGRSGERGTKTSVSVNSLVLKPEDVELSASVDVRFVSE